MNLLLKKFFQFLFIVGAIAFIYHNKDSWAELISPTKPCNKPISYSIGAFDTRFGISKEDFIKDIDQASSVWEKVEGKPLFVYNDKGALKIDLVYDYRQKATDQLKVVGGAISSDRDTYDALHIKYDSEKNDYDIKKALLNTKIADYTKEKNAYEAQVNYWNNKGGAPQSDYQSLKEKEKILTAQITSINQDQTVLNNLAKELNTTTTNLNTIAQKLNIKVDTFNTIGSSAGEEFNEGLYISDKDGTRIEVYQFDTNDKLVRLLEHELGHALGLEHVTDPNAIMYRLNSSTNQNPTNADIAELQRVCAQ